MNNPFEKKAGIALIIFTILLLLTMGLHPSGGSIEHIINISGIIIVTHSIAILSVPFGWIGFWGLTRKLGTDHFGSMLAFAIGSLGLIAVVIAAATNGLILPIFLQQYKDAAPETLTAINPILRYGFAINHAFDYIYTAAFCLAILSWSVSILLTRKLARWMGWLGIAMAVIGAAIFISGVAVNNLLGFRIFATIIMIWSLIIGLTLYSQSEK